MPAPLKYLADRNCIESLLAKWQDDGRYYRVELISCDERNHKSLVKFEDGQSYPIDNKDLHIQLNLEKIDDESIVCVLCLDGKSEGANLIIICDLCQMGYHVGCHKPPIEAAFLEDNSDTEWLCKTCLEITDPDRRHKANKNKSQQKPLAAAIVPGPVVAATVTVPATVVDKNVVVKNNLEVKKSVEARKDIDAKKAVELKKGDQPKKGADTKKGVEAEAEVKTGAVVKKDLETKKNVEAKKKEPTSSKPVNEPVAETGQLVDSMHDANDNVEPKAKKVKLPRARKPNAKPQLAA